MIHIIHQVSIVKYARNVDCLLGMEKKMKRYKTADEIHFEREERKRKENKERFLKTVDEIQGHLFPKVEKKITIISVMGKLVLFLLFLTLILGSFWLIKFFTKGLLGI